MTQKCNQQQSQKITVITLILFDPNSKTVRLINEVIFFITDILFCMINNFSSFNKPSKCSISEKWLNERSRNLYQEVFKMVTCQYTAYSSLSRLEKSGISVSSLSYTSSSFSVLNVSTGAISFNKFCRRISTSTCVNRERLCGSILKRPCVKLTS
jgi:hypothetical protein